MSFTCKAAGSWKEAAGFTGMPCLCVSYQVLVRVGRG